MGQNALEPWLREILRCPVTLARLTDGVGPDGEPVVRVGRDELRLAYPVRDGVPILLADEARRVR
jgi:uncharacterized protein YbaR (Trm112 family)